MRWLNTLFSRNHPAEDLFAGPRPEASMIVVGDIHGRADLLEALIVQLAQEVGAEHSLVFVGDYVDRGEDSAGVLGLLQALQGALWPNRVICLRGNHESMLLDFLDDPEGMGPFWLQNGGTYTLASYGISPPDLNPVSLREARNALKDVMGSEAEAWLRNLPLSFCSGNVVAVHAGADPHRPIDEQDELHLLWGHPDFLETPRKDGIWIAHGHTIVDTPHAHAGRISVDTGAYATHRLSAAVISSAECRFLSTV